MFALATSVEEAREQILAKDNYVYESELNLQPAIYDSPAGFAVWGGG